ncbi:hypothetical protein KR009_009655 [Drosophila setifemur]|nr:hypothetical protein KR009_009655 [Drosophila setifemur]
MLKWTASAQRLNEMIPMEAPIPLDQRRLQRRQRRHRRATIANKENVPDVVGYTSTPVPVSRLRNSPLVLAPLSDIRNVTPEAMPRNPAQQRVQSVRYATTLPQFAEDYSPNGLPTGQHLALRGLTQLDPFLGQPRYISAAAQLKKRKLDADFVATMEGEQEQGLEKEPEQEQEKKPEPPVKTTPLRPVTPQPASTQMGDQTLDRLIDAILDSACKADAGSKKKPRRSTFNLRRRTLVKQQLDADCVREVLSPSYAPGDDPASDLSFGLVPIPQVMKTPEPASPMGKISHNMLIQMPTPRVGKHPSPPVNPVNPPHPAAAAAAWDNTFCLETPVRSLKRTRKEQVAKESPLKRFKVDERNYFEVGLALPSSIYV